MTTRRVATLKTSPPMKNAGRSRKAVRTEIVAYPIGTIQHEIEGFDFSRDF